MDNMKRVHVKVVTVMAEVVEEHEGTTTLKLLNGFGDLVVRFDDAALLAATDVAR